MWGCSARCFGSLLSLAVIIAAVELLSPLGLLPGALGVVVGLASFTVALISI